MKTPFDTIIHSLGIEGNVETKKVIDNHTYTKLYNEIDKYISDKKHLKDVLKIRKFIIYSVVENVNITVIKEHNTIDFILLNGSVLRISSLDVDSIELTRILVPKSDRQKGIGTNLVILVFSIIENILGYIPRIELECTGGIGIGETHEEIDVSSQVNFFQKFNFQVCDSLPSSRSYIKMWRSPSPRIPPTLGRKYSYN